MYFLLSVFKMLKLMISYYLVCYCSCAESSVCSCHTGSHAHCSIFCSAVTLVCVIFFSQNCIMRDYPLTSLSHLNCHFIFLIRFWVAVRFQMMFFRQRTGQFPSTEELKIDSKIICWAFHSDSQENLCGSLLPNEPSWSDMRAIGFGFWFTDATQLRPKVMHSVIAVISKKLIHLIDHRNSKTLCSVPASLKINEFRSLSV